MVFKNDFNSVRFFIERMSGILHNMVLVEGDKIYHSLATSSCFIQAESCEIDIPYCISNDNDLEEAIEIAKSGQAVFILGERHSNTLVLPLTHVQNTIVQIDEIKQVGAKSNFIKGYLCEHRICDSFLVDTVMECVIYDEIASKMKAISKKHGISHEILYDICSKLKSHDGLIDDIYNILNT